MLEMEAGRDSMVCFWVGPDDLKEDIMRGKAACQEDLCAPGLLLFDVRFPSSVYSSLVEADSFLLEVRREKPHRKAIA